MVRYDEMMAGLHRGGCDEAIAPPTLRRSDPPDGSRAASNSELEILRNPDQSTTWTGVIVTHLAESNAKDPAAAVMDTIAKRIPTLSDGIPVSCARLSGSWWVPGDPPVPVIAGDDNPTPKSMLARYELGREPPLRILVAPDGAWVSFFVHHAAFDGSLLFSAIRVLLCGIPPPEPRPVQTGRAEIPWRVLARLASPADPVAPSQVPPSSDVFIWQELPRVGGGVTSVLPEACIAAVASHSERRGLPLRRVGISLGLSRSEGDVNHSTYRRIDIRLGDPFAPAFKRALAADADPWQVRHPVRLLRLAAPVMSRLSDTIVFTNNGRLSMPGVIQAEGYPVARGRSAVAFCATRVAGGRSTLSLRTRDVNREDAETILGEAIARLGK